MKKRKKGNRKSPKGARAKTRPKLETPGEFEAKNRQPLESLPALEETKQLNPAEFADVLFGGIGAFPTWKDAQPETENAEFEKRIKGLEREISDKATDHDLGVLAKAGVDRKTTLRLLALAVHEEGDKNWAPMMRKQQEALKSVAGRLETLARAAKELASDPRSRVQAWFFHYAHGGVLGMARPKPLKDDPGVSLTISGMRPLAKRWREEARKFGQFLDFYGDKRVNLRVPLLLCRVCISLGKSEPAHWEELANLLTDAFEATGKEKCFSADWLRKLWKRRGRLMLRLWLEFSTEPPPPKPTRHDPIGGPISPLESPLFRRASS